MNENADQGGTRMLAQTLVVIAGPTGGGAAELLAERRETLPQRFLRDRISMLAPRDSDELRARVAALAIESDDPDARGWAVEELHARVAEWLESHQDVGIRTTLHRSDAVARRVMDHAADRGCRIECVFVAPRHADALFTIEERPADETVTAAAARAASWYMSREGLLAQTHRWTSVELVRSEGRSRRTVGTWTPETGFRRAPDGPPLHAGERELTDGLTHRGGRATARPERGTTGDAETGPERPAGTPSGAQAEATPVAARPPERRRPSGLDNLFRYLHDVFKIALPIIEDAAGREAAAVWLAREQQAGGGRVELAAAGEPARVIVNHYQPAQEPDGPREEYGPEDSGELRYDVVGYATDDTYVRSSWDHRGHGIGRATEGRMNLRADGTDGWYVHVALDENERPLAHTARLMSMPEEPMDDGRQVELDDRDDKLLTLLLGCWPEEPEEKP